MTGGIVTGLSVQIQDDRSHASKALLHTYRYKLSLYSQE